MHRIPQIASKCLDLGFLFRSTKRTIFRSWVDMIILCAQPIRVYLNAKNKYLKIKTLFENPKKTAKQYIIISTIKYQKLT